MTPGAYATNLPPVTQLSEQPTVRSFLPRVWSRNAHAKHRLAGGHGAAAALKY